MIEQGYKAILVLARFIDYSTILRAMHFNAGVSVEVVTGSVVAKKRAAIIDRFESGGINVLVATDLFGEGFDMPKIDGLVMAQMGKSITKVYQYIGRSLRPSQGKDHALIVDVADRYKWFGQWFEIRLGVYSLEPSFRENIIDNFWSSRIDLIARTVDKGEDRVFKQL